jgi:hypothetical protein
MPPGLGPVEAALNVTKTVHNDGESPCFGPGVVFVYLVPVSAMTRPSAS